MVTEKAESTSDGALRGVQPRDTQELIMELDEKHVKTHENPFKAQENLENLNDMGNDLVLESDLEKDVHAHIANQLDPFGKEGLKEGEE